MMIHFRIRHPSLYQCKPRSPFHQKQQALALYAQTKRGYNSFRGTPRSCTSTCSVVKRQTSCCSSNIHKYTAKTVSTNNPLRRSFNSTTKPFFFEHHQSLRYNLRSFSAGAATTATTTATASSTSVKKTVGDVFLDNLGKVFLSAIAMIIAALVRSSMATTNKNNLRTTIEESSALDPFEIDDLRVANYDLDRQVFETILNGVEKEFGSLGEEIKVDYKAFVSVVMNVMKGIKGEGFTIQLGYLLDRVVIALLKSQNISSSSTTTDMQQTLNGNEEHDDDKIDLSLLLIALSLCMRGDIRDRIEVLFEIMTRREKGQLQQQGQEENEDRQQVVSKELIVEIIGHLQKTCQLVPDAQIIESDTKYPVQQYRVGTPLELTQLGIVMKKNELSEEALREEYEKGTEGRGRSQSLWTCDDFHHLLRSRAVCAWGECYVKKKGLN